MPWGSFGTVHLATLAIAVVLNVLIYLSIRKKSRTRQVLTLFFLSLISAGFVLVGVFGSPLNIFKALPISFWGLNAVLLPYAILTRGKKICNILLLWSVGSVMALVFNSSMAHVDVFSGEFIIFFIMHVLGAGIPILLFELGLVTRDTRTVKTTLLVTFLAYTGAHLANLAINSANGWSVKEGVNYLSTLAPSSHLLHFFYTIIPAEYWYMVLALPLVVAYMVFWYLPEILDERRKNRALRGKLKDIDRYYDEYEEEYIDDIIDEKYDW